MTTTAILLLLFIAGPALATHDLSNTYPFQLSLHEDYTLYWRFDNDAQNISFAVRVRTTGWVGFGLSPNRQMPQSDVVIGWVDGSGNVRFDVSCPVCESHVLLIHYNMQLFRSLTWALFNPCMYNYKHFRTDLQRAVSFLRLMSIRTGFWLEEKRRVALLHWSSPGTTPHVIPMTGAYRYSTLTYKHTGI